MARNIDECHILAISGGFSAGDEPDGSGKFIANVLPQRHCEGGNKASAGEGRTDTRNLQRIPVLLSSQVFFLMAESENFPLRVPHSSITI